MPSPRRGRTARWLLSLLLLALIAAACSSDGEEAGDPPATTTTAPTTDAESDAATGSDGDEAEDDRPAVPELDPTPLTVDDDVVIGTLDSGLTYYLRTNDAPGSSLTVRLAVDAGSLQQDDPDAGTAHFLEHMLFNGTERWPGNELDRVLQSFGAGIGPDINAYTSYDETVYELTVSTFDEIAVSTAFTVMAEWAENATIDPDEVVNERGVVRNEYRQRIENPQGQSTAELFEIYLSGTPYEGRPPIGTPDEIDATEAAELRAYYDTWYHPENMAVIAVGDLPVDEMLALLNDAFGGVEGRGPAPERPERVQQVPDPAGFADVIAIPDLVPDSLSVDWLRPPSDPSTVGGARVELIDQLIATMLGNRLNDAYLAGALPLDRPPFVSTFEFTRGLSYFGTNLGAADLAVAYEGLLGYLAGAAEGGFTQDELDQAVDEAAAGIDAFEDGLATTQDFEWTNRYVAHFLTGVGAEAPATTIERQRGILADVTVEEVSERWALIHAISGPIGVPIGEDADEMPTAAELEAIAESVTPLEPVARAEAITSLMTAPAAVEPADVIEGQGAYGDVMIRIYDNGLGILFEPSPIQEGVVVMVGESWGGAAMLDLDDFAYAGIASSVVASSGLGGNTTGQVADYLSQTSASLSPYIGDFRHGISGSSTVEDLEVLFQLAHLAFTAPTADPTVLQSNIVQSEEYLDFLVTDPSAQATEALRDAVYGVDYRTTPSRAQLDALDGATVLDVYTSIFDGVDAMAISIVGDADADVIADLADRYLGTLPAGEFGFPEDFSPFPVTTNERIDIDLPPGSGDGGVTLFWQLERAAESEGEVVAAEVLEQIIDSRIFDVIREELAASYGGGASIDFDDNPLPEYTGRIDIDGDPERLDEIVTTVRAELKRLASTGPTVDELTRAITVLSDEWAFINNGDLVAEALIPALSNRAFVSIYDRDGFLAQVTAADVQAIAADLFDPTASIEVRRS